MKNFHRHSVSALLLLTFGILPSRAEPTQITVSAAASLKNALAQIAPQFEKTQPNVTVRFNFASSGTLQRQIEQGAPVDVFIAAADKNMDELASQNLVDRSTIQVIARNRLVLIVPTSSTRNPVNKGRKPITRFRDLARADVKHVAIGAPSSVPAGKYAQQLLTKIGVWNQVSPKAVQAKDVREVLAQVELGNVDAGVVYQSDAAISNQVRVVAVAPESFHAPIRYPAAVVRDSRNPVAARTFVRFLMSEKAKAVFQKLKFGTK